MNSWGGNFIIPFVGCHPKATKRLERLRGPSCRASSFHPPANHGTYKQWFSYKNGQNLIDKQFLILGPS